ncbi:MAG TPA: IS256 family transposase [Candidatus Deferrimicrobium sp.]|nr:IS256 family transposase [Candidatus Deferrimicrobium sp.]
MALSQSALNDLLEAIRAGDGEDTLREAMRLVLQELIELEASQAIGATRYERTEERTTHRNGSRSRLLSTKAGDVELHIPKLREGSFFPALLEPRRRIDRALWAVVMEAYVHGVSTRKVDDLVVALGIDSGISKSEVSRICRELDDIVGAFRERRLDHVAFPYLFLDATYVKAHDGAQVVSKAIVIATGVTQHGEREVLGLAVGDSEDGAFWTAFLRSLRARGLGGVRLVISDAHEGLKGAIVSILLGSAWQRCRVHFLRNVLARIPKGSAEMVLAAIRTIFAQPDAASAREQLDEIVEKLTPRFPVAAQMLSASREDLLAYTAFPVAHWRKIWSTNPLERVNKEIKRRTDVVGIFPNEAAVTRLAGAVLLEIHDEWQVTSRRYLSEGSMALLDRLGDDDGTKEVDGARALLLAS